MKVGYLRKIVCSCNIIVIQYSLHYLEVDTCFCNYVLWATMLVFILFNSLTETLKSLTAFTIMLEEGALS